MKKKISIILMCNIFMMFNIYSSNYTLPIINLGFIPDFDQIFVLLAPYNINNYDKIRIGKKNDGGYIVPHEISYMIQRCYTYGAGADISFELDLNKLNDNIITYIYDHTTDYPEMIKANIFLKKKD